MACFRTPLIRWLMTAVLLLLGLAAGFLILEFGLRLALYGSLEWRQSDRLPLIRTPHPVLGWLAEPDQTALEHSLEYQHTVSINSRGMRDREYAYEKPEGVFRILVFGDSYIEAAHVADGDGFCDVLESLLADRRVEVLNMGVGGYATVAAWQYLSEEGLRYEPDLVLLGFYGENDVYGNSPELSRQFWGGDNVRYFGQPYAAWDEDTGRLEIVPPDYERSHAGYEERLAAYSPRLHRLDAFRKSLASHLYQQARLRLITRVRTPGHDVHIHFGCYIEDFAALPEDGMRLTPAEYDALWEEAWFLTDQGVLAMAATAWDGDARFVIFNAPSRIQFEHAYEEAVRAEFPELPLNVDLPEERLGRLADRHEIPFINLLPPFRQADAAGRTVNYNHDSHWNAAGHRLAAEAVLARLDAAGLVPPADGAVPARPGPSRQPPF